MRLTDQNIDYIANNLELYGLKNPDLKEDILDHICTYLENEEQLSFDEAYKLAIQQFGGYLSITQIQHETNTQLYFKSAKNRSKVLISFEFITALLIITGSLFKIMHWPFAGILIFSGFIVLILITLPLYFYNKYKAQTLKYQS